MRRFYPQVFHIWFIVLLLMWSSFCNAVSLDFSQDFQILFPPGQFKKNHEKYFYEKYFFLKKKQQLS